MFASYAFPDKNQKPLRMSCSQITKQAVAILSLISGNGYFTGIFNGSGYISKKIYKITNMRLVSHKRIMYKHIRLKM